MSFYLRQFQPAQLLLLSLLLCVVVCLGADTPAQLQAANTACAKLDSVYIPDPSGRFNAFYACCNGQATAMPCLVPSTAAAAGLTPDTGAPVYNPIVGSCQWMPAERAIILYDRTAEAARRHSAGSPGAAQRAVKVAEAAALCASRATALRGTAAAANLTAAVSGLPTAESQYALPELVPTHNPKKYQDDQKQFNLLESGLPKNVISVEPSSVKPTRASGSTSSPGRRLLATPAEIGQYQLIINPKLGRSSTGVITTHVSLIPGTFDVIAWGRLHPDDDPNYEPGVGDGTNNPSAAARYSVKDGTYTPVTSLPGGAPFCSGQSVLANGTLIIMGGDRGRKSQTDGRYDIRLYHDELPEPQRWQLLGARLASPQWYPTQIVLPDQRVLGLGGYYADGEGGNPALTVWNANTGVATNQANVAAAVAWGGWNIYPGLYMLPYTDAPGKYYFYAFSCNYGEIVEMDGGNEMKTVIPLPAWPNPDFCGQTAAGGTSRLLKLKPSDGYTPEIATFGGFASQYTACACETPASTKAYRLRIPRGAVIPSAAPAARAARVAATNGPWQCVAGWSAPLRINAVGDVECMSADGRNCAWDGGDCAAKVANPLARSVACGANHQYLWGNPGYTAPGHWCAAGLVNLGTAPAAATAPWQCMAGFTAPLRLSAAGDVECMSADGKGCAWDGDCAAKAANPTGQSLACGAQHLQLWGITGYDTPAHWCSRARATLGTAPPAVASPWKCLSGRPGPLRVNFKGDVECSSADGISCDWGGDCQAKLATAGGAPLACGAAHQAAWGVSGYTTEGHWCVDGRSRLRLEGTGAAGPWSCLPVIPAPLRINAAGDVECLSADGQGCAWGTSCEAQLGNAALNQALACGDAHQKLWGIPGYTTPGHWCAVAGEVLPLLGNTPPGGGGVGGYTPLEWLGEDMPEPRLRADSVMLPDGRIVLLNGAKNGVNGGMGPASLTAWLYDPEKPAGQRYTPWASSTIGRHYHSVALLLPDASIFVGGSELTECVPGCTQKQYTYQYQAEKFLPPYAFEPLLSQRPVLQDITSVRQVAMGQTYEWLFQGAVTSATLVATPTVTHQLEMQGRVIELELGPRRAAGGGWTGIQITMPPADANGGLVAPPGYYMLFVNNGELPCKQAQWVQLRSN